MFDVALPDKIENKLAAPLYVEMFVLECGDPVRPVMFRALLGTDADVQRIDEAHHDGEDFFSRESVECDVLVCNGAKPRKMFTEAFDLLVFFPRLSLAEFRV